MTDDMLAGLFSAIIVFISFIMALMNMFIVNELAKQLINKCRAKNYKLALAESCTGGLISSVITSIPGSSDIFECSFITYSNISKKKILDVSENNLNLYGSVSKEVVIDMINGLRKKQTQIFFWQFLALLVLVEVQLINLKGLCGYLML